MITQDLKITFFALLCSILIFSKSYSQTNIDEKHIHVAMRMIGHEVLLSSGDSTSRVLAVENELGRYKIQFESPFQFNPSDLVSLISQVVQKAEIAENYLVEVETCESKQVIYSYEVRNSDRNDLIPCRGRVQPKACYTLFITLKKVDESTRALLATSNEIPPNSQKGNPFFIFLFAAPLLVLIGSVIYLRKKRVKPQLDPDVFQIGDFRFDKRNMELSHKNKITELTSKEADLLFMLYSSANKTLERENILNEVWGDEGDYIGRTLDVFISKLRKKLSADSSLKIVNIRGIGYKFVMNDLN